MPKPLIDIALCLCWLGSTAQHTACLPAAWRAPCGVAVPGRAPGRRVGVEARATRRAPSAVHGCGATWLRLRGGLALAKGLPREAQPPTSSHVAPPGRNEADGGAGGGAGGTAAASGWTATRLEEGFMHLQGELTPRAGDNDAADARPGDHHNALQERVSELSRSAIDLFRSELLLFRRQGQRRRESGDEQQGRAFRRGILVLFEGLDRSGKGTQVDRLVSALEVLIAHACSASSCMLPPLLPM